MLHVCFSPLVNTGWLASCPAPFVSGGVRETICSPPPPGNTAIQDALLDGDGDGALAHLPQVCQLQRVAVAFWAFRPFGFVYSPAWRSMPFSDGLSSRKLRRTDNVFLKASHYKIVQQFPVLILDKPQNQI